jgi:Flp pilus assembly protein TadB
MTTLVLGAIALIGVSVFFFYQWIATSAAVKKMTVIERANAEIADSRRRYNRSSWRERAAAAISEAGLGENIALPLAAWLLLDLLIIVALTVVGVGGIFGAIVSFPVSGATVVLVTGTLAARKRRAVNRQLVQCLQLIAGQLEAGNGAMAALESVIPSLPEPLRGEIMAALEVSGVNSDIVVTFRALAEKYPSRSLNLATAAFEVNRDEGGQISPAIRQAADTLMKDRELNEETDAEISQTRSEFWVIVGTIAFIVILMFMSQARNATDPYENPGAIVALTVAGANFAFGIFRGLRIFAKAKGSV